VQRPERGGVKRIRIELEQVAAYPNLVAAFQQVARGKGGRREVEAFRRNIDVRLARLGQAIMDGSMPLGHYRRFIIHDPKRRTIHAACFDDRLFHHALMNLAGPVLDRALTDATFACRIGMGQHAAVRRVQHYLRRFPWYIQVDIDAYFPSIEHTRLLDLLERRFKGAAFLATLRRVVEGFEVSPGRGLPIGTLTSQHFANYYLDGLDRFIQETLPSRGLVRYMDDSVWWCDDHATARWTLAAVNEYLVRERGLNIKPNARIQRSAQGIAFCGYRVTPGCIRLSRRKQRRYRGRRAAWEQAWSTGHIGALELQRGYAAVHGITAQADSRAWRQEHLRRHPAPEV